MRTERVARALLATALAVGSGCAAAHASSRSWVISRPPPTPTTQHTYSLNQLIRLALSISPQNHAAEAQLRQARLSTRLVRSQYAPQIDFKTLAGMQHTPLAIPRTVSRRGYFISHAQEVLPSLELKWLLFDFGRRRGQLQAARQQARAAAASFSGEREKLVFEVTRAYFTATSAQGKVHAAKQALQAALLTEQAVVDQRRHGRATVVQVAEAHRQSAAMRLRKTQAEGDARTAFANLLATVGMSPDAHFSLVVPGDASVAQTPLQPLRAELDRAMRDRPDIRAAQSQVLAAEANVTTAHAAYRPTIGLKVSVFQNIGRTSSDGSPYSRIDREGNSVFLSFQLPLADGGARATHVAIANAKESQAEDALAATKDTAARQVVQSWNDLRTSLDNRRQARDYAHAAALAYQASLDAYRHGLSSINALSDDEAALARAEASQQAADADVLIAHAALDLATGTQVSP
ncbi:TolC family protein [Dyella sp. A6]|uniref:TolC family protein n=1 Tax=Dyella aluminiiresistens TaxID=3069105 RepID=UPI002E7879B5|nr:TolC family protein [Dyella sp. A6]